MVEKTGVNRGLSVFSDMELNSKNSFSSLKLPDLKPDTFENGANKVLNEKNCKKLIIAGVTAGVALFAGVVLKKTGAVKKLAKHLPFGAKFSKKRGVPKSANDYYDSALKSATGFLTEDIKTLGRPSASGICFLGPKSIGKEEKFEGFIKKLSEAGYRIERMPVVDEVTEESISNFTRATENALRNAKELYNETGKRTAIVVKNIDKIAPDRTVISDPNAAYLLLKFQNFNKAGCTWISDAFDWTLIDPAVKRHERIDHCVVCQPSLKDAASVWNDFLEISLKKGFRDGETKKILIKDTLKKMKKIKKMNR